MRVFVAVDLGEENKKEVDKLLKLLRKKHWPVRWERVDKLHITLAFLGSIKDVGKVKQIVGQTLKSVSSFKLSFKGLGCFPDYEWPRIVWLGLKGDLQSLAALQKQLEKGLAEGGFKLNPKPFVPHITIGRIKSARAGQRREIARQLKAKRKLDFKSQWLVDRVVVYQSQCLAEGSVYKKLFSFFLK